MFLFFLKSKSARPALVKSRLLVFLLCQFSCHPSTTTQAYVTPLSQRAFRQRKEGYIKKLEEQVREMHALEENFKGIQSENYSLREYIIHLQSRLIDTQGEYPQPPPNVDLRHPHARPHEHHPDRSSSRHDGAPVAPMASMSQLNASAARNLAAAGLNSGKHAASEEHPHSAYDHKRYKEQAADEAADEEIIRSQLQQASADGLPAASSMSM